MVLTRESDQLQHLFKLIQLAVDVRYTACLLYTSGSGNYFSLPDEIFLLGLNAGELAVYSYRKRCEDRKTHQCWPNDWEICGYE